MGDDNIWVFRVQPQVNTLEEYIGLARHELIAIPEVVEENKANRLPVSGERIDTSCLLVPFNGLHQGFHIVEYLEHTCYSSRIVLRICS